MEGLRRAGTGAAEGRAAAAAPADRPAPSRGTPQGSRGRCPRSPGTPSCAPGVAN